MTVSTDLKSIRYEGNGVTDTFAFNGRIFSTSDLAIDILTRSTDAVVETLATSNYTVSIVSDESAEIVITPAKVPSASQDILIYRAIDRTQDLRLPTGSVFPAKDVEDGLDRVTILVQDVASDVDRVLKFPLNVSGITAAELPSPVDGMLLSWDGDTGRIGNTDVADISTELDTVFTTLTSGDFITYDGTNWVNSSNDALPVDGIQTTGSSGVLVKNSGGTTVMTIGPTNTTNVNIAGGLTLGGTLSGASLAAGTTPYSALASAAIAIVSDIRTAVASKIVDAVTMLGFLRPYDATNNTTSGTSTLFTGIPAGVRRVRVSFEDVTQATASGRYTVRIGPSGGVETTGYDSVSTFVSSAVGTNTTSTVDYVLINLIASGGTIQGWFEINLSSDSSNTWVLSGVLSSPNQSGTLHFGGRKSLAGAIERLQVSTSAGNFSNGKIRVEAFYV